MVYGIATGPVFEAGIAKPISLNIPSIIKASLDRKRAGVVGPGKSVGAYIHIDDGTCTERWEFGILIDLNLCSG